MEQQQLLFSMKQAAQMLNLSYRAVECLTSTGALPCVRVGRRVLIHTDVLRQFAQHGHGKGVRQGN